jgi:WD40 repeat protein/uncharacterized caspase-like protein
MVTILLFALGSHAMYAQVPSLVLPSANTNQMQYMAISPDEVYAATADLDNEIKIWEIASGKLIRTIVCESLSAGIIFIPKIHSVIVSSRQIIQYDLRSNRQDTILKYEYCAGIAASLDGKWVAALGSPNNTVPFQLFMFQVTDRLKLVDSISTNYGNDEVKFNSANHTIIVYGNKTPELFATPTLKRIAPLKGHIASVANVSFSKLGHEILTTSNDGTCRLWNAKNGQQIMTYEGHGGDVWDAALYKNEQRVITTSSDRLAIIWDKKTGKKIKQITAHNDYVYRARVSEDGKTYTLSDGKGYCTVWDAQKDSLLFSFNSGKGSAYFLTYLKKGNQLLVGNYEPLLTRWDITAKKKIMQYGMLNERFTNMDVSNDETTLLTASRDGNIRSIDIATGRINFNSKKYNDDNWATSVQFHPDNNLMVVSGGYQPTYLLQPNGKTKSATELKADTFDPYSFFSPDGQYYAHVNSNNLQVYRSVDNSLVLVDEKLSLFSRHHFSEDSKYIITGKKNAIAVWDLTSGKKVFQNQVASNYPDFLYINRTASYVIYGDNNMGEVIIWSMEMNKEWLNFKNIKYACFTSNPDILLMITKDNIVSHYSIIQKKIITNWPMKANMSAANYQYYENKGWIIGISGDIIKIYDLALGGIIKNFTGETVKLGKSTERLYLQKNDVIEIYNTKTWELVYKHYALPGKDYLVQDAYGRFDGTDVARKQLYFVCGQEVIEMEQVKDLLWVPNLVERIMSNESINAPSIHTLKICNYTPTVSQVMNNLKDYQFEITPRDGGLGEVITYVNGIEVRIDLPKELIKKANTYTLLIPKNELSKFMPGGNENIVSVKAFTADNSLTSRNIEIDEVVIKKDSTPPNLYAIIVGVSDYKGTELDLKYAAKDGNDIANALGTAAKKLLNKNNNEHVFIYNFTTEGNRLQLPEKAAIKKQMDEISKKALPNDILLLFFAGHGVMAGPSEEKQFYFLTADASALSANNNLAQTGISTAELTEWMKPERIKAQKRILIFDACNSGQAIKDFVKIGGNDNGYLSARSDDNAQIIKAIDKLNEKSGFFILSASASNQSAYELGRFSQGLLTYSLLKAIKQQPDILDEGKYLNVSKWFNAAEQSVTELSKENGARQEPQLVSNTNFNIGIVDKEVISGIVLPQEKPLFTASIFQNNDESIADDNLEFSNTLNLKLAQVSSSGIASKIIYTNTTTAPNAFTLTGRYTVTGNTLSVTVNIKQNRITLHKFTASGIIDEMPALAASIIEKASSWWQSQPQNQ